MKRTNKDLVARIERINSIFDKTHYLEKRSRSLNAIAKILREKSQRYKKTIERTQRDLSLSIGHHLQYDIHTLVACAIGAKGAKFSSFGTSHRIVGKCHPRLANTLRRLGSIGALSSVTHSKNIIGKCAEVKAANYMLSSKPTLTISEIEFTAAIRPRTLEKIERCPNCVHVFGKEK